MLDCVKKSNRKQQTRRGQGYIWRRGLNFSTFEYIFLEYNNVCFKIPTNMAIVTNTSTLYLDSHPTQLTDRFTGGSTRMQ